MKRSLLFLTYALLMFSSSRADDDDGGGGESSEEFLKIQNETSSWEIQTNLIKKLFEEYNTEAIPNPVNLTFGVSIITAKLCDVYSTLETNLWIKMAWNDPRLRWCEDEFPVKTLSLSHSAVWLPDLRLYNVADLSTGDLLWSCDNKVNVYIHSNGDILWISPCQFTTRCKNTLKEFPYKEQSCLLNFASWTHDSAKLGLSIYNDKTDLDMEHFEDITDWNVISAHGHVTEKFHECCEEPYSHFTLNVTLQKKPEVSYCNAK